MSPSLTESLFGKRDYDDPKNSGKDLFDTNQQQLPFKKFHRPGPDRSPQKRPREVASTVIFKTEEYEIEWSNSSLATAGTESNAVPSTKKDRSTGSTFSSTTIPVEARAQEAAHMIQQCGVGILKHCVSIPVEIEREIQLRQTLIEKALRERNHKSEDIFSYKEVASRCPGRLDIKLSLQEKSLNDAIEPLQLISNSLMGGQAELLYTGLILNYPGSDAQPFHQDGHPLFPEYSDSEIELPPYAMNIFVPLHDQTVEMGPTEFDLEDSDSSIIVAPILQKGDALCYDYRTVHRGTSNRTQTTRRILYLLFARPWFKDHINFGQESVFTK